MPRVKDIMDPHVRTVTGEASLREVARLMRDTNTGAIPVVDENGSPRGIITDRDLVVRTLASDMSPEEFKAGDIATRNVVTVSPDDDARDAVKVLRKHSLKRVGVAKDGILVGMLSLGDVALAIDPDSALADVAAAIADPTTPVTGGA
jgi:CBS domain-containing protein